MTDQEYIKACIESFDPEEASKRISDYIKTSLEYQKRTFEIEQMLSNSKTQTNENTKKSG